MDWDVKFKYEMPSAKGTLKAYEMSKAKFINGIIAKRDSCSRCGRSRFFRFFNGCLEPPDPPTCRSFKPPKEVERYRNEEN